MTKQINLTAKGQVTIPKDVRDALGLKPGEPVEFGWNDRGEVVVRKGRVDGTQHRHRLEQALAAIDAAARKYGAATSGQTSDEYMATIREPLPDLR